MIGAHYGGGLYPHPYIVGLVERDRDCVDAKEICRRQYCVRGMVGSQLSQRWHRSHCGGVCGSRGLLVSGHRRAGGAGLRQPSKVRDMGGHIFFGAQASPAVRLRPGHYRGQLVCRLGVGNAQRIPRCRRLQQRTRAGAAAEQRRMHFRGCSQPDGAHHRPPASACTDRLISGRTAAARLSASPTVGTPCCRHFDAPTCRDVMLASARRRRRRRPTL